MHIPNYKGNGLKFEVHPNHRSASHGCLAASSSSKSYLKLLRSLSSTRFHPFLCENYSSTSLSIICSHNRHHLPQFPRSFCFCVHGSGLTNDENDESTHTHNTHASGCKGGMIWPTFSCRAAGWKWTLNKPLEFRVQVNSGQSSVQYMQNHHSNWAQTEMPYLKRSKKITKENEW